MKCVSTSANGKMAKARRPTAATVSRERISTIAKDKKAPAFVLRGSNERISTIAKGKKALALALRGSNERISTNANGKMAKASLGGTLRPFKG